MKKGDLVQGSSPCSLCAKLPVVRSITDPGASGSWVVIGCPSPGCVCNVVASVTLEGALAGWNNAQTVTSKDLVRELAHFERIERQIQLAVHEMTPEMISAGEVAMSEITEVLNRHQFPAELAVHLWSTRISIRNIKQRVAMLPSGDN